MTMKFPPVAQLVPHSGPALLLDAVLAETSEGIQVAAHIQATHPYFVPGHGVPAWVGIEMMAQAIGAHAGLDAHRAHRAPGSGMLLGTRRYRAHVAYFTEGSHLAITAQREYSEANGVAACACNIECDGRTLAEATLIVIKTAAEEPA